MLPVAASPGRLSAVHRHREGLAVCITVSLVISLPMLDGAPVKLSRASELVAAACSTQYHSVSRRRSLFEETVVMEAE